MGYLPKIGDTVRIRNYTGMLHPMTVWEIKETRPDLSRIDIYARKNDTRFDDYEHWIENEKLIRVFGISTQPSNNDPDIAGA